MKVKIRNIGVIVSGKLEEPILKGDCLVLENGKITFVGFENDLDDKNFDKVIDANGNTVFPGLIDAHIHPVFGDYTPRQNTIGWISGYLHGGVTTMISAGEPHLPGRPRDVAGAKALAILAKKSFDKMRPGGVKVHAGAVILEKGMTEDDFKELSQHGVWLVGEIGLGSVYKPEDARPLVQLARKYGMKVKIHTGGTSIPGSTTVGAEEVIAILPDVVGHINGGPTAMPLEDAFRIVDETDIALEFVYCGNMKALQEIMKYIQKKNALGRVILGTDSPSGTGIIPLGILRLLAFISSICELEPEKVISLATGNTARVYGLNTSVIEVGKEADLVLADVPMGGVGENALDALKNGDVPGISAVLIDGEVKVLKSKFTPPPSRMAEVTKGGN